MDLSDELKLRQAIAQQGILLGRQQEELTASHQAISEMSRQLAGITQQLEQLQNNPPMAPNASLLPDAEVAIPRRSRPCLNPPAPYSGEPNSCR